jgi:hypothetical protein
LHLIAFPELEIDSELQTKRTVASISLNLSGIDAKKAFPLIFFEFHKQLETNVAIKNYSTQFDTSIKNPSFDQKKKLKLICTK